MALHLRCIRIWVAVHGRDRAADGVARDSVLCHAGRDGSADSHAYGRGQWQLGAGVLAVVRLRLGWKPGMGVALAVAGLLLTIKIVPALSVLLHFFTAMWWRRKGQLNGRRSHRLHLSVFSHMLLIVLLAKAMFYLHW